MVTIPRIIKRVLRLLGHLDALHYQRGRYEPWFSAYRLPKVGHRWWRHYVVRFGKFELHWSSWKADHAARQQWLDARRNYLRQAERNTKAEAIDVAS